MLKLILMLDCNICGQPFDRVAASTDRDPVAWKSLACDLEYNAENSGWSFQRGAHYCLYCTTEEDYSKGQPALREATDEKEIDF
jgi:hypothetical protein